MPLGTYFDEQVKEIRKFMETPGETVRIIRHEPDSDRIIQKLLVAIDEDEDCPACMVNTKEPFDDAQEFFAKSLARIAEQNEEHRQDLEEARVILPEIPKPSDQNAKAFCKYVSTLAERLPDWVAGYVVLIQPTNVADEKVFKKAVEYIANSTESEWAKYLVFDRRNSPMLEGLEEEHEKIGAQEIHLSPEEIEKRVKEDLESGNLTPKEKRSYTSMTGSFAFSNRKYDEAEKIQKDAIVTAREEGEASEHANALYNLANTYLAQNKLVEAEDTYVETVEVAAAAEIHPMSAMALTNLGVTLQRQGRMEEAIEAFDAAKKMFASLQHRPGEIHVLDNKAASYAAEKQNDEAEATWMEAIELADSIKAPQFKKLRSAALEDLTTKLKRFYKATGQSQKTSKLRSFEGASA